MSSINGSVNLYPPTSGGGPGSSNFVHLNRNEIKERQLITNADKVIPAGWYFLEIQNIGLNPVQIKIGSNDPEDIYPGLKFNSSYTLDFQHSVQELGPEISVLTNSEQVIIHVCYPNDSAVDVTIL